MGVRSRTIGKENQPDDPKTSPCRKGDPIDQEQGNTTMSAILRIVLAFALMGPATAFARAPEKETPPPAVQAEFEGFIAKFRAALKADDSAAVAGMTRMPFMNDADAGDAARFRAKTYPEIFGKSVRACIQKKKPLYARDGLDMHAYQIFCSDSIYTFTRTPAGFLFTDIGAND